MNSTTPLKNCFFLLTALTISGAEAYSRAHLCDWTTQRMCDCLLDCEVFGETMRLLREDFEFKPDGVASVCHVENTTQIEEQVEQIFVKTAERGGFYAPFPVGVQPVPNPTVAQNKELDREVLCNAAKCTAYCSKRANCAEAQKQKCLVVKNHTQAVEGRRRLQLPVDMPLAGDSSHPCADLDCSRSVRNIIFSWGRSCVVLGALVLAGWWGTMVSL